ncbi:DUF3800 domain-containing protein [Nostoc sp. CHAB 5834]|nr:DUF3800 domain-containing protein [Nostoc sp. CHAB 5834]
MATPRLTQHRFLDEAGDTTFYGKGKVPIIGQDGVSSCFILGMVKFKEPLQGIRERVVALQESVANDAYFADVPSIDKKKAKGGYFFHATDDIPEVREKFFRFIHSIDCSFEAVVARKSVEHYAQQHHNKEEELYADLLSHLLKNKVHQDHRMVLTISQRGKTTRNTTLELALQAARRRYVMSQNMKNNKRAAKKILYGFGEMMLESDLKADVVFNIQTPHTDPLLNVADYFCWAVQRVLEKGEVRYYNYLRDKISLVVDLYDPKAGRGKWSNYYKPGNPLTTRNKISPPLH